MFRPASPTGFPDTVPGSRRRRTRGGWFGLIMALVIGLLVWGLPRLQSQLASWALPPLPVEGQVQLWADRDYETNLLRLLDEAHQSIDITMYQAVLPEKAPEDHPILGILRKLGERQRAGVRIRIILDQGVPTGFQRGDDQPNDRARDFLLAQGIDVRVDPGRQTTHTKSLVVDGRFCVIGSTNWSKSALRFNHEQSVLVVSRPLADALTARFEEIWTESAKATAR